MALFEPSFPVLGTLMLGENLAENGNNHDVAGVTHSMRPLRHPPMVSVLFLLASFAGCSRWPDYSPSRKDHSTRFTETRNISERKVWLSWSGEKRNGFVLGYLEGHWDGVRVVCATRADDCPVADIDPAGVNGYDNPNYTRNYAKEITRFYEENPEDDDVPIEYVLVRVTGPQKMNAEQVRLTLHGNR